MLPLRPRNLLPLWSSLAGTARAPGLVHVWRPLRRRLDEAGPAHPSPTLVLGLTGTTRISRSGAMRVDLQPGEALVIAAGVGHRHAPLRPGSTWLGQGFDRSGSDIEVEDGDWLFNAVFSAVPYRALFARLLDPRAGDQARRTALAAVAGHLLDEDWSRQATLPEPALRAANAMRASPMRAIAAAGVVAASGLPTTTAYRHLRKWLGSTPGHALAVRRLAMAASLLDEGVRCVEAGRRCGYSDRTTFARAFRRRYGMSPRAWRTREPTA